MILVGKLKIQKGIKNNENAKCVGIYKYTLSL